MKSLFIFVLIALAQGLAPLGFGAALGTNAPGIPPGSNELHFVGIAANNSLITFRRHITPSNFQLMGFSNANEILTATNGDPLLVFEVPFSQLTNYQAGADFNSLLEPAPGTQFKPTAIVPIMAGTNVRSASTLRLAQGPAGMPVRWIAGDWGHPQVIRNLIATYRAIPNGEVLPGTVPFAVRIPIPRIWVIGYYTKLNKLVLRATSDIHLGPITINRNEIIPQSAMQQWATEARRYDPNLPN